MNEVAIIGRGSQTSHLGTLLDRDGFDVVMVDSPAHAYSSIKRAAPKLVVVCIEFDDPESCQLLSMLKLDTTTARIPLVIVPVPDADRERDDSDAEAPLSFRPALPAWSN
jgi:DNA-binding response OmpR family regulator